MLDDLTKNLKNLSVLYVEDDEQLLKLNLKIFKNLFNSIDYCTNGRNAIEKYNEAFLSNTTYDIVITDIKMPFIDGITLCKKIFQINSEQKIIITSAYNDSEYLEAVIELGIKYYIQKPFYIETLLNTFKKLTKEINDKDTLDKDKITTYFNINRLHQDIFNKKNKILIIIQIINLESLQTFYGIKNIDFKLNKICLDLKKEFENKQSTFYRKGTDKIAYLTTDYLDLEEFSEELLKKFKPTLFNIIIGISDIKNKLLPTAKMALNYCKQNHLRVKKYNVSIDKTIEHKRNIHIHNKILNTIKSNQVYPVYQGIYNKNKKLIKYESLMRLNVRENGENIIYTPDKFMDISKKFNTYYELTKLSLEKMFRFMKTSTYSFSINLSYKDINNNDLTDFIEKNLKEYDLGDRLIIEILESNEIKEYTSINEYIKHLKKYNVRFAIDDFGSGYSNLNHILNLNVDYVKIDGSLIKEILENKKSLILVESIIYFAKKLNLTTIAEFVSSEEIFDKLVSLGVDEFQGFYLSEPQINPQN